MPKSESGTGEARQREKAIRFRGLHTGGILLVLPNIWDPLGARILEAKGFPAVATASAALSASLGYRDGEFIRKGTLIQCLKRIADAVDVPVTADIEAGYGRSPEELADTIEKVLGAGIVGINIEDSLSEGGALRAISEQQDRIRTVRKTADRTGIALTVNARVDTFVSGAFETDAERVDACVERAAAYLGAGADCIYPVGPGDRRTIMELRSRIEGPINILGSASAESLEDLQALGVNRVSFGPFPFRACARRFERIVDELLRDGRSPTMFDDLPSRQDLEGYLAEGYE